MENKKKKALLILTRVPYPEIDGTRKRIMDVIRGVVNDFDLDLLVVGDEKMKDKSRLFLSDFFKKIYCFYFSKFTLLIHAIRSLFSGRPLQAEYYFDSRQASFIRDKIKDYDLVFLHTIRLGRYLEILNTEEKDKIFFDLNDAISLNYQNARKLAAFPWRLIYAFEEKRVRGYETKLLSLVKNANVVSTFDEKYLLDNCRAKGVVPPKFYSIFPGVESHSKVVFEKNENNKIVFFGNIKYPPNMDAAKYFAINIFPELQKKIKDINFVIAGNGSESLVLPSYFGIERLGYVQDLKKLFSSTNLVVAPIRFGAGVPTKIIEALSYGIPVVTTPIGLRGLAIQGSPEECGLKCIEESNVNLWTECLLKLISDKCERENLATSAISFIEKNYLQEKTREKYKKAFLEITGK